MIDFLRKKENRLLAILVICIIVILIIVFNIISSLFSSRTTSDIDFAAFRYPDAQELVESMPSLYKVPGIDLEIYVPEETKVNNAMLCYDEENCFSSYIYSTNDLSDSVWREKLPATFVRSTVTAKPKVNVFNEDSYTTRYMKVEYKDFTYSTKVSFRKQTFYCVFYKIELLNNPNYALYLFAMTGDEDYWLLERMYLDVLFSTIGFENEEYIPSNVETQVIKDDGYHVLYTADKDYDSLVLDIFYPADVELVAMSLKSDTRFVEYYESVEDKDVMHDYYIAGETKMGAIFELNFDCDVEPQVSIRALEYAEYSSK